MDCTSCSGEGSVIRKAFKQDGISYPNAVVKCFECNGTGEICDECGEAINVCNGNHSEEENDEH